MAKELTLCQVREERIFEYSIFPQSAYMKDYSDSFTLGELVSCSLVPRATVWQVLVWSTFDR